MVQVSNKTRYLQNLRQKIVPKSLRFFGIEARSMAESGHSSHPPGCCQASARKRSSGAALRILTSARSAHRRSAAFSEVEAWTAAPNTAGSGSASSDSKARWTWRRHRNMPQTGQIFPRAGFLPVGRRTSIILLSSSSACVKVNGVREQTCAPSPCGRGCLLLSRRKGKELAHQRSQRGGGAGPDQALEGGDPRR